MDTHLWHKNSACTAKYIKRKKKNHHEAFSTEQKKNPLISLQVKRGPLEPISEHNILKTVCTVKFNKDAKKYTEDAPMLDILIYNIFVECVVFIIQQTVDINIINCKRTLHKRKKTKLNIVILLYHVWNYWRYPFD